MRENSTEIQELLRSTIPLKGLCSIQ